MNEFREYVWQTGGTTDKIIAYRTQLIIGQHKVHYLALYNLV